MYFSFSGLRKTNLTLAFDESPNLLYSVDVEAYEGFPQVNLDYHHDTITSNKSVYYVDFIASGRLRAVNIRLGSGVPYNIEIRGNHLNSTIDYSNSAQVGFPSSGGFFTYEDHHTEGTVRFSMGSNLRAIRDGWCSLDTDGVCYVDMTVPENVSGEVRFDRKTRYDLRVHESGWFTTTESLRKVFYKGREDIKLTVSLVRPRFLALWLR